MFYTRPSYPPFLLNSITIFKSPARVESEPNASSGTRKITHTPVVTYNLKRDKRVTKNRTTLFAIPKMQLKLNLIAAACEEMGIGINGTLPWRLKSEMAFFTDMTSRTKDENKKNVVLMGRRTWECIPKKFRPLKGRINMVLTSQSLDLGNEAITCKSIPAALDAISQPGLKDQVESIWVIGGSSVYKASLESPNFHRLYLTRVKKHFECDTFFPTIPNNLVLVDDPKVPKGTQEENGIQYEYLVYGREEQT